MTNLEEDIIEDLLIFGFDYSIKKYNVTKSYCTQLISKWDATMPVICIHPKDSTCECGAFRYEFATQRKKF